jgi:hypothetical protein
MPGSSSKTVFASSVGEPNQCSWLNQNDAAPLIIAIYKHMFTVMYVSIRKSNQIYLDLMLK